MNRYADCKSRFDFDTTVSLRRTNTIQDHVTYPPTNTKHDPYPFPS